MKAAGQGSRLQSGLIVSSNHSCCSLRTGSIAGTAACNAAPQTHWTTLACGLAVTQNSLFGAEADHRDSRCLVCFPFLVTSIVSHERVSVSWPDLRRFSVRRSASMARGSHRIVQDRQQRTRRNPLLRIHLSRYDSRCRLGQRSTSSLVVTKITFAVRRDFHPQNCRSQMCDLAQELNRRLGISRLQFSCCGTSTAYRSNPAAITFTRLCSLLLPHLQQKLVPAFANTSLSNVVGLAMRDHADAHMSVRIYSEGLHAAAADIHRLTRLSGT